MGGARESPAQKDVTKITISGLIRPETGTYILSNACHIVTCLKTGKAFMYPCNILVDLKSSL